MSAEGRGGAERSFRLLYLGPFLSYGDRFAIPPLLVSIARDLDESLAAVTAVATLYFFFYGIMQPVYGVLSDRFGRVRVMRAALVGMGLANLAAAASPNLRLLIVSKAVTGAFAAGILPTSLVYVADKVSFARRQQLIANVLAAGAVGTVFAIVGAGLLADHSAWRVMFVIPGLLAVALANRLARLPESLSQGKGAGPLVQGRVVLSRPWAVFLIVLALGEGAVMLGFLTFLAPALEAKGHSPAVAGAVVATYGVAVFGGMQILKRVLVRTSASPSALIILGGSFLITAYLVAAASQEVANILVASVLIGSAFAFLHSTLQTWATEVVPEARGTAVSLFVTSVFTGAALSTAAVGGLAANEEYQGLFLIAAGLTLPLVAAASLGRALYGRTGAHPMPTASGSSSGEPVVHDE